MKNEHQSDIAMQEKITKMNNTVFVCRERKGEKMQDDLGRHEACACVRAFGLIERWEQGKSGVESGRLGIER